MSSSDVALCDSLAKTTAVEGTPLGMVLMAQWHLKQVARVAVLEAFSSIPNATKIFFYKNYHLSILLVAFEKNALCTL